MSPLVNLLQPAFSVEPLLGPIDLRDYVQYVQWVIVGGESGSGARPMHPAWVRQIRDACLKAKVPFFFKQWGEYRMREFGADDVFPEWLRLGKKKAGRLLDGKIWNEFPEHLL